MNHFRDYTTNEVNKAFGDLWNVAWAEGAYSTLYCVKKIIGEETYEEVWEVLGKSAPHIKKHIDAMIAADAEESKDETNT